MEEETQAGPALWNTEGEKEAALVKQEGPIDSFGVTKGIERMALPEAKGSNGGRERERVEDSSESMALAIQEGSKEWWGYSSEQAHH